MNEFLKELDQSKGKYFISGLGCAVFTGPSVAWIKELLRSGYCIRFHSQEINKELLKEKVESLNKEKSNE